MAFKVLHNSDNSLSQPMVQLEVLSDPKSFGGISFQDKLIAHGLKELLRQPLQTLQINVGKVCNQTCTHCHVDAGPTRRESMSSEIAQLVLEFAASSQITTVDITGGAPEMNPNFRMLVERSRQLGKRVIDRCNLTILLANGYTDLPEFLADQQINIVASLPCYLEQNVDSQRGNGVFRKSIEAIQRLNTLGYGQPNSGLTLDLVYNPVGTGLPPSQERLEHDYHRELLERYGIVFNQLLTITNIPVSRFLDDLIRNQKYELYMQKLIESFNFSNVSQLMCRSLISVDWQGFLYDCDFNQMLDLPLRSEGKRLHIAELTDELLLSRNIEVNNHCFGCTAGCGSGCSGALTQ